MNKRAKLLVIFAVAGGGAVAATLTLSTAFVGQTASYRQNIYKITSVSSDQRGDKISVSEWVSLATGTWRVDFENQTYISSEDSYVVIDNETGSVYHRTGLPSFMGDLHTAPDGVLALRAHFKGDSTLPNLGFHLAVGENGDGKTTLSALDTNGKQAFRVTIGDRVTDEEAQAIDILDTQPSKPEVVDTEFAVGQAPFTNTNAYWFGRAVGKWHVIAAAEHKRVRTPAEIAGGMGPRGEAQAYVTFYELQGIQRQVHSLDS